MTKVIFVLIDGLNAKSSKHMSYLSAHEQQGVYYGFMNCELPSLSRPIYASIFTGQTPLESQVTHNGKAFLSNHLYTNSFFYKMFLNKKSTAQAAYYWMRELYCNEIYDAQKHRLSIHNDLPVTFGIYYDSDFYPDEFVFQDAESLRINFNPDFLLVHSMGVDAAGHAHGGDSTAYRQAVRKVDLYLANYVPKWLQDGCVVIVTSDHGMHADGAHNDTVEEVRQVPYWILGQLPKNLAVPTRQTQWYDLLCNYYELR